MMESFRCCGVSLLCMSVLTDDIEKGTCTTPEITCHSFSRHAVVSSFVRAISVSYLSSATTYFHGSRKASVRVSPIMVAEPGY